jgi:hypothetical protein
MLICLLAVLTAARCLAQTTEDFSIQQPPSYVEQLPQSPPLQEPSPLAGKSLFPDASIGLDRSLEIPPVPSFRDLLGYRFSASSVSQAPPFQDPSSAANETPVTGEPINLDGSEKVVPVPSLSDFWGYRTSTGSLEWIPSSSEQLGMFSIQWDHYVKSGIQNGIGIGMGFHFLDGPVQTDMPPRVYDFSIGYQIRNQIGPLKFDLASSVLAASDFVGDAHKGILFPSHAVGFLTVRPDLDLVFGADYLDRGDVKLLPVGGLIWTPNPDMRFEFVFPRPRAVFQLTENQRLYVAGELGGGTWAIDREFHRNDLATYHDLRICVGVEYLDKDGERTAIELGYLFDRRLEYTSGIGDMQLDDAVMISLVTRF